MFAEIFTVVAPVFVISALGFGWVRLDLPFDSGDVGRLVMMIGTPCLVFSSLTRQTVDWAEFGQVVLAAAAVMGISLLLGWVMLRALRWTVAGYLTTLVHGNTGNMGLPLVLLAFGESGLALGMAYFLVNSVSQYTLGLGLAAGTFHPRQLLRQPLIWAVVIALMVMATGMTPPAWITATTSLLGGMVIPLMLLMLGTSLARLRLADARQALVVAIARLALGFAAGTLVIWSLGLTGVLAAVVIVQACMPAAVFNYVFAEMYGNQPQKVAAVILQGTVLTFATLPFLVAYALTLAGR